MSETVAHGIIAADALQQYVDVLGTIVDECRVHFDDSGLSATAVDPANVAMFDAELSRGAFESYDAPGQVRIGVNVSKLDDFLGSASGEDLVEIGVDMETRHLTLGYRTVEHRMALIDPDAIREEPDIPDLELPNYAELPAADWKEARKNVELVSDHIWIAGDVVAGDGQLTLYAEGDTDRTELVYGQEELERDEINDDTESLFSLEYVKDLLKPVPSDATIGTEFGDEFPMVLSWDSHEEHIDVTYSLAPRIQSD
jgi:proliferating cell nuclear antigen